FSRSSVGRDASPMIAVQAGSILSATAPLQSSRSPARAELCDQHSARTIDDASSRKQTDDIIISPFEIETIGAGPYIAGLARSPTAFIGSLQLRRAYCHIRPACR